jgi:hypothetical protein
MNMMKPASVGWDGTFSRLGFVCSANHPDNPVHPVKYLEKRAGQD